MLENVRDGLLGFVLVLSNWLSPGNRSAELDIQSITMADSGYVISCEMDIGWNRQIGELVEAGIPLRFGVSAYTDEGDTIAFLRTFQYNVTDYTYVYTDTSINNYSDTVFISKKYPQVLIGMRRCRRWSFYINRSVKTCNLKVELLPSRVARLNRIVDMSRVLGVRELAKTVVVKESR